MNERQPTYRQLTGVFYASIAILFFAHQAWGGRAYLRVVGPPALRFQDVTTNYYVFDPKSFDPKSVPAETTSNAVSQLAETPTNAVIPSAVVPVTAPINPETTSDQKNDPAKNYNFAFPYSTASDLLTVTPQMITEYLKPDVSETNRFDHPGAVVFVPVQMPFMPPTTKGTAESRATYQSK